MKRKAKGEEFKELTLDYILSNTPFDSFPNCICPIDSFPDSMSVVFCTTKCYSPCSNFKNFSFILDVCDNSDCGLDSVCEDCMNKISSFKKIMMKLKAVFPNRNSDKAVNKRVNEYIDWCNEISKSLQEARDNR